LAHLLFFGGENLHQSGYFDTLPSSLSLIKLSLGGSKDEHFFLLSNVMPDRVKERVDSEQPGNTSEPFPVTNLQVKSTS
jgi:hypothetical protein